jgi:hypothetical protein
VLCLAGLAAALVSNTNVGNQRVSGEDFTRVHVFNATLENGSINHTSIHDSMLHDFEVQDATLRWTYMSGGSVERILSENSRLDDVSVHDSTLVDTTVCRDTDCRLVSGQMSGSYEDLEEHARLVGDAPETATPGSWYDIRVEDAASGMLTVTNDPSGVTAFGFDNRAPDSNVEMLELRSDEGNETFALGAAMEVPSDFTLRVHVAETGIIDGSTLGLVLDLGGHGLRPAITTLNVTATQLAFAPLEGQAFAPYLADNVARLVISVGTDANGNVDRDLDIAYTLNVTHVQTPSDVHLVGDPQEHTYLHGDSELFSDQPFKYVNPTSLEAHHPATLEKILRDDVGLPGITYGAANFYATHFVAQSPYPTTAELTAATTASNGTALSAGPFVIEFGALPADDSSAATPFGPGGDPMFPGTGTLRVHFVDADGEPVEAKDGWALKVQETPESHTVEMVVALDGKGSTFDQPLAASPLVGLPFGDFFDHEYLVCLEADGEEVCANDGGLVAIQTGEVTEVTIRVE